MSARYTFQIEYIDMLAMCLQTFPVHSKDNLIMVSDFVNTIKSKSEINYFHVGRK